MDNNYSSYCLKCKNKKEMINGQIKVNKKGNKYIQAQCKDCGCKMNRFIKKDSKLEPLREFKKE